jgi:hypothetical protein
MSIPPPYSSFSINPYSMPLYIDLLDLIVLSYHGFGIKKRAGHQAIISWYPAQYPLRSSIQSITSLSCSKSELRHFVSRSSGVAVRVGFQLASRLSPCIEGMNQTVACTCSTVHPIHDNYRNPWFQKRHEALRLVALSCERACGACLLRLFCD